MDKLYALRLRSIWTTFWKEHFSYWMVCLYLIFEYVRPQAILPALDVLPWEKVFIGLAALGLVADRQRRWVRDQANVWITLFLLAILLSTLFAEYPGVSISHWFDFFSWYLIYFLIINTVNTGRRYFLFLGIYILASFKLSLFGARTWALHGFSFTSWGISGPPGFFENSGELSVQMLMFSPIAYELAIFLKKHVSGIKFWSLLAIPLTGVMTVLGASSRGAQVALAAQGLFVAYQRRLNWKVLGVIALLACGAYAMLPLQERMRLSAVGSDDTSIQRLDYLKAGVEMIREHPLFGVGYFNFPEDYARHYPLQLFHGSAQLPHNIFIQVGTDCGLIGLAIFGLLIFRIFKATRDIRRTCAANANAPAFAIPVARGLATAACGFLVAGQFVSIAYYPFFWINLALTVSLTNVVAREGAQAVTGRAASAVALKAKARDSRKRAAMQAG